MFENSLTQSSEIGSVFIYVIFNAVASRRQDSSKTFNPS
jgi:hypothetical protein